MSKRRSTLHQLPIEQLVRGKYQPRQHFDPQKLQELADSIKSLGGLLQPVVARPISHNQYEIVAGERRWRAAQLAGFTEISCLICDYSDDQALEAAIVENISRTDLNPIEEAAAYQRLIAEFNYLHEEVAAAVGKSRAAITNSLRLLKLDLKVQDLLISGMITEGHGKILASLPHHLQVSLAIKASEKAWNVRKLELEAKKIQQPQAQDCYGDANLTHLENALSEHIGNRTQLEYEDKGGGYLRIRFNNIDELEGHFERLGFKPNS